MLTNLQEMFSEGVGPPAEGFEIQGQGETPTMVPDGSEVTEDVRLDRARNAVQQMRQSVDRMDKKLPQNSPPPQEKQEERRAPSLRNVFKG